MKHHGLKPALITVLAALLVGSLVQAADPEKQPEQDRDLGKKIDLLIQEIKRDRQAMDKLLDTLLAERKQNDEKATQLERRLKMLEERVDQLTSGQTRVTTRRPPNVPAATIRLVNRLPVQATVYINGTMYAVPGLGQIEVPNQTERMLTYSYTADGYGRSSTRQRFLRAGSTWELTIHEP